MKNNAVINYVFVQARQRYHKKCWWCRWYDDPYCRSVCYALCRQLWWICLWYPAGCTGDEYTIVAAGQEMLERYFNCT